MQAQKDEKTTKKGRKKRLNVHASINPSTGRKYTEKHTGESDPTETNVC